MMPTSRSRTQTTNTRGKDPAREQVQKLLMKQFKRANLEYIDQLRWRSSTEGITEGITEEIVSEKLEVGHYGNEVVFALFDPQGGFRKYPGNVTLRSASCVFKYEDPTPITLLKPFNILGQQRLRAYIKGLFILRGHARGYSSTISSQPFLSAVRAVNKKLARNIISSTLLYTRALLI